MELLGPSRSEIGLPLDPLAIAPLEPFDRAPLEPFCRAEARNLFDAVCPVELRVLNLGIRVQDLDCRV